MIQIDSRIDKDVLRQFAAQVIHIPPKVRHLLEESLLKEEGPEYYHGQIAALQFAHQLIPAGMEAQGVIGATLAILSKHMIDKGWW